MEKKFNVDRRTTKKKVDYHLNKDSIKNIILENNLFNRKSPGKQGNLIRAAFCFATNNLVTTPGREIYGKNLKGADPGSHLDIELLDQQSNEKKEAIQKYLNNKSLENFSDTIDFAALPVNFQQHLGKTEFDRIRKIQKNQNKYYASN